MQAARVRARGLHVRFVPIQNHDLRAAPRQLQGHRRADDAGADDRDIRLDPPERLPPHGHPRRLRGWKGLPVAAPFRLLDGDRSERNGTRRRPGREEGRNVGRRTAFRVHEPGERSGAEAALTATHAGPRQALDRGEGRRGIAAGPPHRAGRRFLAAADDRVVGQRRGVEGGLREQAPERALEAQGRSSATESRPHRRRSRGPARSPPPRGRPAPWRPSRRRSPRRRRWRRYGHGWSGPPGPSRPPPRRHGPAHGGGRSRAAAPARPAAGSPC